MLEIRPVQPSVEEVRQLIAELDNYQAELYPAESNHLDPLAELERDHVRFLGAFATGGERQLLGCGAIKLLGDYAELKRMFVRPTARGQGVGSQLLAALEQLAAAEQIRVVRLETGVKQPEALGLYHGRGYRPIEAFGDYRPDPLSVFMEKRLL